MKSIRGNLQVSTCVVRQLGDQFVFMFSTLWGFQNLIVIFRCVSECESSAFGCCFVSANGLLVDVCQCCCFLMFVCLPLSKLSLL